jgi:putative membrane protein
MSRILIPILVLVVILLGVVFHLRNDQLIILDYFLGSSESYFSIWLVGSFAIGAILGMLTVIPTILKSKREILRLQRDLKMNEKEINNLRVMPVKD